MFIPTCISSVFLYRCVYKNCVYLTCHLWVTLEILEYKIFSYWVIEVAMTCLQIIKAMTCLQIIKAMTCLQIIKCDETVLRLGHSLNWNMYLKFYGDLWPVMPSAGCTARGDLLPLRHIYMEQLNVCMLQNGCIKFDQFLFIILQKQQESPFWIVSEYSFNWNRCRSVDLDRDYVVG